MKEVASIDVVVAVHNSPEHVRSCLRSIEETLADEGSNARVLLVDDCSDTYTQKLLEQFQKETALDQVQVLRNDRNLGYLRSVNRGIEAGSSELVVLVNSDVVLTEGWQRKVRSGFMSDQKIGVVSAVSNWANWTCIPFPGGFNVDQLSSAVERLADVPRINDINNASGFFFASRRSVYEECGLFDEVYGPGYYEEADFCMRILKKGYRVVVDTGLYVFHHGWASFGEEQRTANMNRNMDIFLNRWKDDYERYEKSWEEENPVQNLSEALSRPALWKEFRDKESVLRIDRKSKSGEKPKVLYLAHALRLYGGVISIVQLVNELNSNGFDANLVVYGDIDPNVMALFPTYFRPILFENEDDLVNNCPDYDLLVATHFPTVDVGYKIDSIKKARGLSTKLVYFVQDFEPDFVGKDDPWRAVIEKNYRRTNLICKSDWLRKKLSFYSDSVKVVPLGLNLDCFRPISQIKDFDVISMARAKSERRNFSMVKEVYGYLKKINPKIRLALYGEKDIENEFDFEVYNFGKLTKLTEVSKAISRSRVLLDPSTFQGFGRPGLEAMASGVSTVLTREGGIVEYAKHRHNCLLVDPCNKVDIVGKVLELLDSPKLQAKLVKEGLSTASLYCHRREGALTAEYFRELLVEELGENSLEVSNF